MLIGLIQSGILLSYSFDQEIYLAKKRDFGEACVPSNNKVLFKNLHYIGINKEKCDIVCFNNSSNENFEFVTVSKFAWKPYKIRHLAADAMWTLFWYFFLL